MKTLFTRTLLVLAAACLPLGMVGCGGGGGSEGGGPSAYMVQTDTCTVEQFVNGVAGILTTPAMSSYGKCLEVIMYCENGTMNDNGTGSGTGTIRFALGNGDQIVYIVNYTVKPDSTGQIGELTIDFVGRESGGVGTGIYNSCRAYLGVGCTSAATMDCDALWVSGSQVVLEFGGGHAFTSGKTGVRDVNKINFYGNWDPETGTYPLLGEDEFGTLQGWSSSYLDSGAGTVLYYISNRFVETTNN